MTQPITAAQLTELYRLAAATNTDLERACQRRWYAATPEGLNQKQASDLISYLKLQEMVEGKARR